VPVKLSLYYADYSMVLIYMKQRMEEGMRYKDFTIRESFSHIFSFSIVTNDLFSCISINRKG